jgi:hypothetical protein
VVIKQYLLNLLIGVDQLINAFLGGDVDETLSSRLGKAMQQCKMCRFVCIILNIFDKNHCQKSIESDEGSGDLWKW